MESPAAYGPADEDRVDVPSTPDEANGSDDAAQRERELQEKLRKRALASRKGSDGHRHARHSRSPSTGRSRSRASSAVPRSRSPSRDTHKSRASRSSGRTRDPEHAPDRDRDRDRDRQRERKRRRDDTYPRYEDDEDRERRYYPRASYPDDRERDRETRYRRRDRDRYDDYYRDNRDRRTDYYPAGYTYDREDDYPSSRRSRHSTSPRPRSVSGPVPEEEGYEARSVFCSQLSARLGQRDLGMFFEERLGEGTVRDVRIVTDRVTRRSKGVGYVELRSTSLVPQALALSGQLLFGLPILVQLTDTNKGEGPQVGPDGQVIPGTASMPRPNLPGFGSPMAVPGVPMLPGLNTGAPIHLNALLPGSAGGGRQHQNTAARLYVGSLHFSLTDVEVKQVFEPFGEVEYVDLHREPGGKSKGFAFVQFKHPEDAKKALEHMNGFELAGRAIKVGNVNERGSGGGGGSTNNLNSGAGATQLSAMDEGGGGGLNPMTRAALMQKLARTDMQESATSSLPPKPDTPVRPNIPQSMPSSSLLLKNMFNPAEETARDWDIELADDVKDEVESKYGKVAAIFVEKESDGEIYVKFHDVPSATNALQGLNGRWFGGRTIQAHYLSDAMANVKFSQG